MRGFQSLDNMAGSTKHPLFGFLPRHVTAEQVRKVVVCDLLVSAWYDRSLTSLQDGNENPFTRLPHSPQYHKILEARKKLPVFAQMDDFYKIVSSSLPFVCEGAMEPAPKVAPGIKAMCR